MWLQALIVLVFSGALEEQIYRGLVQYNAMCALGVGGIYYAAALAYGLSNIASLVVLPAVVG